MNTNGEISKEYNGELSKEYIIGTIKAHFGNRTNISYDELIRFTQSEWVRTLLATAAETYFRLSGRRKIEGATCLESFCRFFKDEMFSEVNYEI